MRYAPSATLALVLLAAVPASAADLGKSGFVDSGGVKIHYVTAGKGPLVVMLHGFPDYWYTWRDQMPVLAKHFQVVAIDLRGYNKSDKPEGVENYKIDKLVGDVAAVLDHFKQDKAVIVGHDWGGLDRLDLRHDPPRQDRSAHHPQSAAPQGPDPRAGQQPGAAEEQRSTPATSRSPTRPSKRHARDAGVLGQGAGGAARSTSRRSSGRRWRGC